MIRHAMVSLFLLAAACSGGEKASPEKAAQETAPASAKETISVPQFEISKNPADISRGEQVFAEKGCTACHKIGGGKLVGPDLKGVTARRDETWIKRMILRPDVMIKEDDTAKKLLAEHLTPMPNQNVDPEKELPPLLAYLKSIE